MFEEVGIQIEELNPIINKIQTCTKTFSPMYKQETSTQDGTREQMRRQYKK